LTNRLKEAKPTLKAPETSIQNAECFATEARYGGILTTYLNPPRQRRFSPVAAVPKSLTNRTEGSIRILEENP